MPNDQKTEVRSKRTLILRVVCGAAILGFFLLLIMYFWLLSNVFNFLQSIEVRQWVFGVTIVAGAILTIFLPIRLTSTKVQRKEKNENLEHLLSDPYVRRTILRFEIGGITAGAVAVIFAVWGIYETNYQSRLSEQALRDQRISSAWQILAQKGSGSTGKSYALGILTKYTDEQLIGLQLGCKDIAGEKGEDKYCQLPTHIAKIEIGNEERDETVISDSDFSYANFSKVNFRRVFLAEVNFSNAVFYDVHFNSSELSEVNFSQTYFDELKFSDVAFNGVDFSRARLQGVIEQSTFTDVSFKNLDLDGFATNLLGSLIIKDSALYQVDFTNVVLYGNGFRLLNIVNLSQNVDAKNQLRMIDGSYSTEKQFNISGAKICKTEEDQYKQWCSGIGKNEVCQSNIGCWKDASQKFFDHAWYYRNNPPTGISKLDFELKLRVGCEEGVNIGDEDAECFGGKKYTAKELVASKFNVPSGKSN